MTVDGGLLPRIGVDLVPEFEHGRLIRLAQQLEALAFGTLWYADERFYRDTYVGLAACACATKTIRLGPGVSDPFTRHPASVALAIASLQELSGGRMVLGLGAGNIGFENLGLRLDRPAVALRDAIEIIRGMVRGDVVSRSGGVIEVTDVRPTFAAPSPVPIYLSADGPRIQRLAGELADGVILMHCASPRLLAMKLERVREGAARRPQPPRIVARLDLSISTDRGAAMRMAKARLSRLLWRSYPDITYMKVLGLTLPRALNELLAAAGPFTDAHGLERYWRFVDHIPDELVYPIALAGTPSDVRQQLRDVFSGDAEEVMFYLLIPEGETIETCISLLAESAR